MPFNIKHLLFAPLIWQQGKRVKQNTLRLHEPRGDRHGIVPIHLPNGDLANQPETQESTKEQAKASYRLMIVGDSSAAGVGVDTQIQGLSGQLTKQLAKQAKVYNHYTHIDWQLHATTGHNSFDLLRRLYVLHASPYPLDLMIVVVGVNDTTQMMSVANWQANLKEIITVAQLKHKPKHIIFSAIPPVRHLPALPTPLNEFIANKASKLDDVMEKICEEHDRIHYVSFDFPFSSSTLKSKNNKKQIHKYFASDGFHPSELTYKLWANQLASFITKL